VFDIILTTFVQLLTGWHLVYLLLGVLLGLIFGVLPALGGAAGMAVLLPFVFGMPPSLALPMMIGMMAVTPTADTFSSVLMGIPGGNSSQATVLDGFPMSKRGEAARALSAAFTSSLVGGLFGAVVLTFAIVAAKPLLLMIGFSEQLLLVLLALTMVGTLAGPNPLKGLATCGLGLLAGMIGTAPTSGEQRLTGDLAYLLDGPPLPIIALGLFAIPEIVDLVRRQSSISKTGVSIGSGWLEGVKDTFRHWGLVLRCSAIGVVVGAMPGLGGSVINWMAYSHAVQSAKDKSQFGKGDVRGVLAPESANNAQDGGHLIPTLLFGIPAGSSMALLLSGFILIGLKPGLEMVTSNLSLTYTIIWSLAIANVIGAGACVLISQPIARLTTVPSTIIAPFMFVIIFFAAAQSTRSWYDLIAVMVIGALGVYLKRFGWPRPAFMIGFVLSTQLENGIYRVVQVYQWSFLTRPVALILLGVVVISLGMALWYREHGRVLTKEGVHSHLGRLPQVLFFAVLFCATAYALIESFQWQFAAALFPRSVAIVTLLLLAGVGGVLLTAKAPNTAFYELEREEFSAEVEQHSNEYFLLWLLGYIGAIALVGFTLGSAAFVYAFMWRKAKVSHLTCLLSAGSVFALLAGLNFWLGISYVDGLLQTLDLPWPLN
jgi:putative tricarboxylic transport membrane protein